MRKNLRVSDLTTAGYNAEFDLKPNGFSSYGRRDHFTPLWYPNGNYTVFSEVIDVWTPVGMLKCNLYDFVNIQGSLFDDWHSAPK